MDGCRPSSRSGRGRRPSRACSRRRPLRDRSARRPNSGRHGSSSSMVMSSRRRVAIARASARSAACDPGLSRRTHRPTVRLVAERPGDALRRGVVVPRRRERPFGAESFEREVQDGGSHLLSDALALSARPSHEPDSKVWVWRKSRARMSCWPTITPSYQTVKGRCQASFVQVARIRQWNCSALRSSCGEGSSVHGNRNGISLGS